MNLEVLAFVLYLLAMLETGFLWDFRKVFLHSASAILAAAMNAADSQILVA